LNIAKEYIDTLNIICTFSGFAVSYIYFNAIINRLHDIDRSGWWSILIFTPFFTVIIRFLNLPSIFIFIIIVIPIIFSIVIGCIDTKQEFNQYEYKKKNDRHILTININKFLFV